MKYLVYNEQDANLLRGKQFIDSVELPFKTFRNRLDAYEEARWGVLELENESIMLVSEIDCNGYSGDIIYEVVNVNDEARGHVVDLFGNKQLIRYGVREKEETDTVNIKAWFYNFEEAEEYAYELYAESTEAGKTVLIDIYLDDKFKRNILIFSDT